MNKLPIMEGVIARRVLLNFRADPDVVGRLIPEPLAAVTQNGAAVIGVCLIRLEQLRPKGLPHQIGVASENMAHRVAIQFPTSAGLKDGVFIWRRETDQSLITLLGGRLFPGVHQAATFGVTENQSSLAMTVSTANHVADVQFRSRVVAEWNATSLFPRFHDAQEFFRKGDCGFSCALRTGKLEGMQLRTLKWKMQPLAVEEVAAAFYHDETRFPKGSVTFDCGLLMRGIPHEWHELSEVPELVS